MTGGEEMMLRSYLKVVLALVCGICLILSMVPVATCADFPAEETIKIVVPAEAGGAEEYSGQGSGAIPPAVLGGHRPGGESSGGGRQDRPGEVSEDDPGWLHNYLQQSAQEHHLRVHVQSRLQDQGVLTDLRMGSLLQHSRSQR